MRPETVFSASTEHSTKDMAKERDREEKERKNVKGREKEKKKHKVMNEIKRENGEVKQPIKSWWKRTHAYQLIHVELKVVLVLIDQSVLQNFTG